MERTLTADAVRDRAAELFVGLKSECDAPNQEAEVAKLLREKLPGAGTLPFIGVLTADGKWVHGFSGHRSPDQFLADLDKIDASPLLDASPATVKKLEKIAAAAEKALAKQQWSKVFKAESAAAKLIGRHASRNTVSAAAAKARGVAESGLSKAYDALAGGETRDEARKTLYQLSKAFRGQPEGDEAAAGIKASDRLGRLAEIAEEHRAAARAKAATEFAGTRWAKLFTE